MENQNLEPYLRLLRQSFLLQGAGQDAALSLLQEEFRIFSFDKGQLIFGEGQPYSQGCLGLMVSGRATAYSSGSAILRSFGKGDVFGAAALYTPGAEAFSRVVAESPGEALLLPLAGIQKLMGEDGRVAENYLRFLAQRIAFLNRKIAAFTAGEAKNRLAAHIAANCQWDESGRPLFAGNISRLAQALNISRASLYRAFNHLAEQGILHREGKYFIIDNPQELANL